MTTYCSPLPTVDVVIELLNRNSVKELVLIKRIHEPLGWALPGGFVNYGENVEQAAIREVFEETGLKVELVALLGVYSNPWRDPRQHNFSTVFVAWACDSPQAGTDAIQIGLFSLSNLPNILCFDHELILQHYGQWQSGVRTAASIQPIDMTIRTNKV